MSTNNDKKGWEEILKLLKAEETVNGWVVPFGFMDDVKKVFESVEASAYERGRREVIEELRKMIDEAINTTDGQTMIGLGIARGFCRKLLLNQSGIDKPQRVSLDTFKEIVGQHNARILNQFQLQGTADMPIIAYDERVCLVPAIEIATKETLSILNDMK